MLTCRIRGHLVIADISGYTQFACANIGGLGLKIVMHYGEFIKAEIAGTEELTGPDVIAVHRLMKNTVHAATGVDDYLLVTQACVDQLGT